LTQSRRSRPALVGRRQVKQGRKGTSP